MEEMKTKKEKEVNTKWDRFRNRSQPRQGPVDMAHRYVVWIQVRHTGYILKAFRRGLQIALGQNRQL
jgi:hypothetical protein